MSKNQLREFTAESGDWTAQQEADSQPCGVTLTLTQGTAKLVLWLSPADIGAMCELMETARDDAMAALVRR